MYKRQRYKSAVLDVRYKEKNIHDVLQMTVREALTFFAANPKAVSYTHLDVYKRQEIRTMRSPRACSRFPPGAGSTFSTN